MMPLAGGLAHAHPEFGVSVNLILTGWQIMPTDYRITVCPPGFENLTTSLKMKN